MTGKKFNFAGPGTCFSQRNKRGDKPITYADQCAKLHDHWYNKKDASRVQIKRADDDFVRCVKASPNYRLGDSVNKKLMTGVFAVMRTLILLIRARCNVRSWWLCGHLCVVCVSAPHCFLVRSIAPRVANTACSVGHGSRPRRRHHLKLRSQLSASNEV